MFLADYEKDKCIEKLQEITVSDAEEHEDGHIYPVYKYCIDPKEAHIRIRDAILHLKSQNQRIRELKAELDEIDLSQTEDSEQDEKDKQIRELEAHLRHKECQTEYMRGQIEVYQKIFECLKFE